MEARTSSAMSWAYSDILLMIAVPIHIYGPSFRFRLFVFAEVLDVPKKSC